MSLFPDIGVRLGDLRVLPQAADWLADIPTPVLATLETNARLFSGLEFAGLGLLSRSPDAQKLMVQAPLIFLLLLEAASTGLVGANKLFALCQEQEDAALNEDVHEDENEASLAPDETATEVGHGPILCTGHHRGPAQGNRQWAIGSRQ